MTQRSVCVRRYLCGEETTLCVIVLVVELPTMQCTVIGIMNAQTHTNSYKQI